MIKKILIITGTFLMISLGFGQSDNITIISPDTIEINLKSLYPSNDTLVVKLAEDIKVTLPEEGFLQKYGILLGPFLGSLFAALIAIYSIWKTNKNNLELEQKKFDTQRQISENTYCGVLYSVYSELLAHDKIDENIHSEIDQFLDYFSDKLKIQVDNPFSEFPLEFLKLSRSKILDFSKFETNNLSFLTHYINVLDSVQRDLNLSRIREVIKDETDDESLINGLDAYFKQIRGTLEKLSILRKDLKNNIVEIIKSFPQSDVNL
jgi:hypothetical protein